MRNQPPVFPVDKLVIPEAVTFNLKNGIPVYKIEAGTEDIIRLEFTFLMPHGHYASTINLYPF